MRKTANYKELVRQKLSQMRFNRLFDKFGIVYEPQTPINVAKMEKFPGKIQ